MLRDLRQPIFAAVEAAAELATPPVAESLPPVEVAPVIEPPAAAPTHEREEGRSTPAPVPSVEEPAVVEAEAPV